MRRWLLIACLFGLSAAALRADPDEPPLVVLAAGESLGHLDPCNCVEGMQGGFSRRLALVGKLRAELGAAPVVLDGGDLTGPQQTQPRVLEAKTRAALELLGRAELPVLAVGEQDLRLGVERLQTLARQAGVTLLCANATGAAGAPFETVFHHTAGEHTLALTAVLDPDLGDPSGALELGDPRAAIDALWGEAQKALGTRRVVLFHGDYARAQELLTGAPVDLILCGHDRSRAPREAGSWEGVPVVELVRDARRLVRLDLHGDAPRRQVYALDGHVPDDPWASRRVAAYYEEVRGLPEAPRRAVPTGGGFVGAETCGACHPDAYEVFQGTKHHGAQARVLAAQPEHPGNGTRECTVCHVTGFGFASGFRSLEETPGLGEVGCEACHGVGGAHALAPPDQKRGYGLKTGFPQSWQATCVGCHDPTNSPDFDFEAALARIRHWKPR